MCTEKRKREEEKKVVASKRTHYNTSPNHDMQKECAVVITPYNGGLKNVTGSAIPGRSLGKTQDYLTLLAAGDFLLSVVGG